MPPRWKTINQNPDNVQVVAADSICLRRRNGDVYRYNGKLWKPVGTSADRLWGWGYWRAETEETLHERVSGGSWDVVNKNTKVKDLVFFSNSLYQLRTDGSVWAQESSGRGGNASWRSIDNNPSTQELVAGQTLYMRHSNGQIFAWDGSRWNLISNDTRTIQIAAGEAGLYQRQKDGSIYKYLGGNSWDLIDSSADNAHIAVAKFPYRATTKGGIYRLVDSSGVWQKLPDPIEVQGESVKGPSGGTSEGMGAEEMYDGGFSDSSSEILIRIGNGAAGQSGLIKGKLTAFSFFDTFTDL